MKLKLFGEFGPNQVNNLNNIEISDWKKYLKKFESLDHINELSDYFADFEDEWLGDVEVKEHTEDDYGNPLDESVWSVCIRYYSWPRGLLINDFLKKYKQTIQMIHSHGKFIRKNAIELRISLINSPTWIGYFLPLEDIDNMKYIMSRCKGLVSNVNESLKVGLIQSNFTRVRG